MDFYNPGFFRFPHIFQNKFNYAVKPKSLANQTITIHKNRYHIERELGRGAFGKVHAARRLTDGKPVAVKVVSLAFMDQQHARMLGEAFLNEVRMSRRLSQDSRHIAHIYDFDFNWADGWSYFVMDVAQHDLDKVLRSQGRLSPAERKMIWRQLVDMAVTLHNHEIVHLDIKPPNLLVFPGNLIKLADLGIAQRAHEGRIGPTGTRPYSAPEVTMVPRGQMSPTSRKSDSWSWGAILYRMTYGIQPNDTQAPYSDNPQFNQSPTSDRQLRSVLHYTLAHNPKERLSALELAEHPYTRTP